MALETRAFRDRDLHHLVFNFDPRRHLATEPPLPLFRWLQWLRRVVHAARLDSVGRPFSPFRQAISSRCSLTVCFRAATSPNNSTSRASSFARLRSESEDDGHTSAQNR